MYHVNFSLVDKPDLIFEVLVQQDFSISKERTNKYNDFYSPDNFYTTYFGVLMEEVFQNDVLKLWNENAYIIVRVPDGAIYSFRMPEELNDKMSLEEMDELIDEHVFLLDTKQFMENDKSIKAQEAQKIYEFIQIVQKSGYYPQRVVFWYNVSESKQNKEGRASVSFTDWREIVSSSQVELRIDENLFNTTEN